MVAVPAPRRSSGRARALLALIVPAGVVVLGIAIEQLLSAPIARSWFVLLALTVITGWSTLRMRDVPISFSISDTFTIAATLLYGVAAGTVLAVADALVMSLRVAVSHAPGMAVRAAFNAAATALAMWIAGSVFFALTRTGPLADHPGTISDVIGPLGLFAALYFLLNTGFVAVAVAQERGGSIVAVWRAHLSALWLTYFGGASIAAVLVLMTVGNLVDLRTVIVLLPLLLILHVTYRASLDRMAERMEHYSQVEELLRSERQARARADAASRLKDEFLTTISHELRTPATGILGWVRLLRSGRMDADQSARALDALDRAAATQARLLDDLVDMSRIVRGTLRIDPEPTDVSEVLRGAIETLGPAIGAKQMQLTVDVPAGLPRVHADPERLQQVFWNLLSNAVKFSDPGGAIAVTARTDACRLVVRVSDTGRGIEPDILPYVFDRFRQADGSTTRSHGGLGLGLAIVRHLIELHGGVVAAYSDGPGRGAAFEVMLPLPASANVDR